MKQCAWIALFCLQAVSAPPSHLTVEGVRAVKAPPGGSGEWVIELRVHDGFHVQANPPSKPNLIATRVTVEDADRIKVGRPVYPQGEPYRIEALGMAVATYSGRFEVRVPVRVLKKAVAGKRQVPGKVRYQACDEKLCYQPTDAVFSAPIEITAP